MASATIDTSREFLASLSTDDLVRLYEHYSEQMAVKHGDRQMWTGALKNARGSRRKSVQVEIDRLGRMLWDLENLCNQYGSEMNRRGLL